jgi:ubiquinone/menaquinone biosynthesis C-methylase UbiE
MNSIIPDLPTGWTSVDSSANPELYLKFLAATRDGAREYFMAHPEKYDFLKLEPGLRILDVGFGNGFDLEMIWYHTKNLQPPCKLYGIDNSQIMFATASPRLRAVGADVRLFTTDIIHPLKLIDNTFDRVYCRTLLQHLNDPASALRMMAQKCKVGGLVAVIDTDWDSYRHTGIYDSVALDLADKIKLSIQIPSYDIVAKLPQLFKDNHLQTVLHTSETAAVDVGFFPVDIDVHTFVGKKL